MNKGDIYQPSHWPAWKVGPRGRAAIFAYQEDVPRGWVNPEEFFDMLEASSLLHDYLIKPLRHGYARTT